MEFGTELAVDRIAIYLLLACLMTPVIKVQENQLYIDGSAMLPKQCLTAIYIPAAIYAVVPCTDRA